MQEVVDIKRIFEVRMYIDCASKERDVIMSKTTSAVFLARSEISFESYCRAEMDGPLRSFSWVPSSSLVVGFQ